jgi:DNA-binding SARP family transcriptional activator/predicted ATPase
VSTLDIRLLGGFHLSDSEEPQRRLEHGVHTPRLQSLLAYLLLHRHAPQVRFHLAFTFWPDVSETQARNNLRQALHQLRHALPDADGLLRVDANTVWWQPSIPTRLDVAEFEAAAHAAQSERHTGPAELRQALLAALQWYGGDLLPACYDEWISAPRAELRRQARLACGRLVRLLEEERNYAAALEYAQRLLVFDNLDETTCLSLMRLHALNGDRAAALHVYQEYATLLQRELDALPGAELQAAYDRLHRRVAQPDAAQTRPAESAAPLPLIGRQAEWERLQALWKRAQRGESLLALITGEAGIGKSRLAEELQHWTSRQGVVTAATRAYAAEGRLAYAPISEWLRSRPLAAALAQLDKVWRSEIAHLLPELLAADRSLPPPAPLHEHWQRQRLFEALARAVLAVDAPTLLLIDDLQWCDQETLEWLHFLLRFDARARLFVLGTARSEEMHENPALIALLRALQGGARLHQLPLEPLDAVEVAHLAGSIAERPISVDETLHLFAETEGNPLFVVEMMRAAQWGQPAREQPAPGGEPLSAELQSLPPKVYAVIAGRLSQLSPLARELAGIAATVGRAFTVDVLAHAGGKDEEALVDALDELWRRRIIRQQGNSAYDFSHDKLRDVTYGELSPIQKRRLHRRVAQAQETLYAADLDPLCAQLAAHYEQAGQAATAIGYYLRAGAVAQRVHANQEATALYRKGLALLNQLPADAQRSSAELALQTSLVVPLATNSGYGSNDVIVACDRSLALAQQLGAAPDTAVLRALAIGRVVRNELPQAYALGKQLLALAQRGEDAILFTEAHYVLGVTTFFQGEFGRSRTHLEEAVTHYEAERSSLHIARYAQDPKVVCLSRLALTLWHLGCFAQAAQTLQAALALADDLAHPFSLVYARYWSAVYHQHCGDVGATLAETETCIALAEEHRFHAFRHLAQTLRGWALAEQGSLAAGLMEQERSLAAARATGAEFQAHYHLGLLAEQFGKQGNATRGLELIEAALAGSAQRGDHWCAAALWRRKGELLLASGALAPAKDALQRSLALAQAQAAKALELSAALRLTQLATAGESRRQKADSGLESG